MIARTYHTGIVVKDIEQMTAFYRDVLGLELLRTVENLAPSEGDHTGIPAAQRRLAFLTTDAHDHQIELIQYLEPHSPTGEVRQHWGLGTMHLCFIVHNLHEFYSQLELQGVTFVTPPYEKTRSDGQLIRVCYGQDPEGNWLEFLEEL